MTTGQGEPLVSQRSPFIDDRGVIQHLLDAPFASAVVITSVKGAIRGNHYHQTDFHYCWLQRGGLTYYHRPVGDSNPPQAWAIRPGQIFYTPPMYEHAMHFTEDSVMLAFARNSRETVHYETDIVRVPPIV